MTPTHNRKLFSRIAVKDISSAYWTIEASSESFVENKVYTPNRVPGKASGLQNLGSGLRMLHRFISAKFLAKACQVDPRPPKELIQQDAKYY